VTCGYGTRADRIEAFYLPSYSPELTRTNVSTPTSNTHWERTSEIAIGIAIAIEGTPNGTRHERLDVYRLAIGYVAWVYEIAARLEGIHRAARDQWLRASQSIPFNIAEGNGKTADADRRRYFKIARGSARNAQRSRTYWLSERRWTKPKARNERINWTAWCQRKRPLNP
jgi:four helix bundle protein